MRFASLLISGVLVLSTSAAWASGWSPAERTGFSRAYGTQGTPIGTQASLKLTTFKQGRHGVSRQQFLGSNRVVQMNVTEKFPSGARVGSPKLLATQGSLTERGNIATRAGNLRILDAKTGATLRIQKDPTPAKRVWYTK